MPMWTMSLLVATLLVLHRSRLWFAHNDELIGGLIMNLQLFITICKKIHLRTNKAYALYLWFCATKYLCHSFFMPLIIVIFDATYFGKLPSIWDYTLPWTRSANKCLNFSIACCRSRSTIVMTDVVRKQLCCKVHVHPIIVESHSMLVFLGLCGR